MNALDIAGEGHFLSCCGMGLLKTKKATPTIKRSMVEGMFLKYEGRKGGEKD